MHLTSHLVALLTLVPATVFGGKNCHHFMVSYALSCSGEEGSYCRRGESTLGFSGHALFKATQKDYLKWVRTPGVGGTCGGYCNTPYTAEPKRFTGLTWYMDCFAARLFDDFRVYLPAPPSGVELAFMDAKCKVYCDFKSERSCNFVFGKCKPH